MAAQLRQIFLGTRAIECRWVAGDPSLPVIVLLHEGLGCVTLWRDFPERLARATGHRVFVYSRFGYGGSAAEPGPWPVDYLQREAVQVLPRVLAAAGIGDCVLLGHSDGATIALVYAGATQDSRVRGVIVMAPHVFAEACGVASIQQLRQAYAQGLRQKLAKYHGANVDCAFHGWSEAWTQPAFAQWNVASFLPGIGVPLLQLQGAQDHYGTQAQLRAIEAGVGGGCHTVLLAACQHAPHFEQPALTLRLIRDYLSGEGHANRVGLRPASV